MPDGRAFDAEKIRKFLRPARMVGGRTYLSSQAVHTMSPTSTAPGAVQFNSALKASQEGYPSVPASQRTGPTSGQGAPLQDLSKGNDADVMNLQ